MENGKCPDLANILPLAPYFWNGYEINRKYGRYLVTNRDTSHFLKQGKLTKTIVR